MICNDMTVLLKSRALALGVVALLACSPSANHAEGEAIATDDSNTGTSAPAGAEDEIRAWAFERHGGDTQIFQIFFGDFTGDGAPDALAWVLYPTGGNSSALDAELFRNENGRMVYLRSAAEVFGSRPRDVAFAPGRITLTTTMPRPGEPRCCPSGSQNWTIETK